MSLSGSPIFHLPLDLEWGAGFWGGVGCRLEFVRVYLVEDEYEIDFNVPALRPSPALFFPTFEGVVFSMCISTLRFHHALMFAVDSVWMDQLEEVAMQPLAPHNILIHPSSV